MDDLILYYENTGNTEYAEALAKHLNIMLTAEISEAKKYEIILHINDDGLSLEGKGQMLKADLTKMLPRLKQNNLFSEMLVKAARPKSFEGTPFAIDATAGFGEDSLLLAASGFRVLMFEYDPVIAALLKDSLKQAANNHLLAEAVSRMELIEGNSIEYMKNTEYKPDIILLDPMFPERQKSALVKKKFQLLHMLEHPCSEEEKILESAMLAHPKKIIIKRPLKGTYLAGIKPSYSLNGKAIRYDCIVPLQQ